MFLQENKTVDFACRSLAAWGADVAQLPTVLTAAPDYDQPHDRNAWVHYRAGDYPAVRTQLDNDALLPLYAWLGKTFTFADHHVGIGSNSTSGHLFAVGGQTPTLKNPPFGPGGPNWDMPSIFLHAQRVGLDWAAFPDQDGYPTKFYTELLTPAAQAHVHPVTAGQPDPFVTMAERGTLPPLVYAWSPAGHDEHPPFQGSDTGYLTRGHDFVWRRVDAVVKAGLWPTTTFILAYDDSGGYADHVVTPDIETAIDARHPAGFQIIGGSRLPLFLFGGHVAQGVHHGWTTHASIPKTVIDPLGLGPFGVPRVDAAPSLVADVNAATTRPTPPAFGTTVTQPTPPKRRPKVVTPPPFPGPLGPPSRARDPQRRQDAPHPQGRHRARRAPEAPQPGAAVTELPRPWCVGSVCWNGRDARW